MPPESAAPATVVVIGGGIAGLAAAARLHEERPDVEIVVLEGSPEIGGKLKLGEIGGVVVDVGAESMLNRRPEGVALARTSGLASAVVHPATTSAQLWNRGEMVPMPKTMMGIPTDLRLLAESGVISKTGMARAAMDAVLPATSLEGRDTSIGGWSRSASDARSSTGWSSRCSEASTPAHAARSRHGRPCRRWWRCWTGTARWARPLPGRSRVPTGDSPVFAGLAGGMGRLPGAVATASGARVETDATVRDLARRPGGGWTLVVGSTQEPRLVHAMR